MESEFKKIVELKTNDELITILVNKQEYKDQLVIAAETELRKRQELQNDNKAA